MARRSKNKQSIYKGILTSHVFTQNGTVFVRGAEDVGTDEWSAINFQWMPVLQLERELGS